MNVTTPSFASDGFSHGINACGKSIVDYTEPACSVVYESWKERFGVFGLALCKKVVVTVLDAKGEPTGKSVVCELRDTLPHRANVKVKGLELELNAAAVKALGLKQPGPVSWEWQEKQ